jgi:hypothetical protein
MIHPKLDTEIDLKYFQLGKYSFKKYSYTYPSGMVSAMTMTLYIVHNRFERPAKV